MSKHTPGPWTKSKRSMLFQISILSDEEHLATVYGESGENEANANLIVAAPRLLAALEIMTVLVALKYGNLDGDVYAEIEKANKAIADAKGESA